MESHILSLISLVIITVHLVGVVQGAFLVSRNPSNIQFLLFKDKGNVQTRKEIPYGNESAFVESGYNATKPLILLLHDSLSNSKTLYDVQLLKNVYLKSQVNANIIIVDYGKLASTNLPFVLSPLSAITRVKGTLNTNLVGKRIAEFICVGMNAKVISGPEAVHIIGFGLGAHIAGAAGRNFIKKVSRPLRRISGLDPSRQFPILRNSGLDETDAQFVDVTYTSVVKDLGVRRGHVQFYLNGGGPHQPSCPNFFPSTERFCSHTTAVYYFAKSIRNKDIQACKCSSSRRCRWTRLQPKQCSRNEQTIYGHSVPEGIRGDFFVQLS